MESYPIELDGELAGRLTVERQGSITVFHADCAMREGLVRISVYGGGREGYLGVLAPEDGRLTLRKRLSRSQTREFPQPIERVGRAGEELYRAEPTVGTKVEDRNREVEYQDGKGESENGKMERGSGTAGDTVTRVGDAAQEVADGSAACGDAELRWFASPDGALVCFDGTRRLAALPLGDPRIPADVEGEPRRIEGRDYLVYRERGGGGA